MTTPFWLFDLDNTLHCADAGIFRLINRAMTEYLADYFAIDIQAASALREQYWHEYGATMTGLRRRIPDFDAEAFLRASHPSAQVRAQVVADFRLPEVLKNIAGPKAVFSNGPSFYVRDILDALNLGGFFQAAFGCDDVGFLCKPDPAAYRRVLAALRVGAHLCVMVDDSPANLRTAQSLGMKTVLVGAAADGGRQFDACVPSIAQLAETAAVLTKNFFKE